MIQTEHRRKVLMDLAERKLGEGVKIRITREGWIAERGGTRVTGKTRRILEWFLREMPDVAAREAR